MNYENESIENERGKHGTARQKIARSFLRHDRKNKRKKNSWEEMGENEEPLPILIIFGLEIK